MRATQAILAVIAFSLLMGCDQINPPTIDATTEETLKQTSRRVRDSLPNDKHEQFDDAIGFLAFDQIELSDLGTGSANNKMHSAVHGKTAQQVIDEGLKLKQEHEDRQRQQALTEISELRKKKMKAESARASLNKFEILRSRFYFKESSFGSKRPIIDLTVKNNTTEAVSRAYFKGTIASPERSVPWLVEDFNYPIAGGIEPGEEKTWSLAPNKFSSWGRVGAPAGAVFTVTVEELAGADGEPVFSARGFSEHDQKRLTELEKKY